MENNKVWTKEFVSMAAITSCFTIIFFLFIVTMVPFATRTFDVSISVGGLVASIFVIGSLIGRVLAGRWSEKYGALKTLEYSLLATIFISLCYFVAYNIETLFIVRVLHGVTAGLISTITGTISILVVPPSRRAEGIAYFSSSAVIGAAFGPFLGILLLKMNHGFEWMFALNILLVSASYLMLKVVKLNVAHSLLSNPISPEQTRRPLLSKIIEWKAVPISFIALMIGFCFSGVTSYLVPYSEEIKLEKAASFYFIVHAICIICTRFFTGRLIDSKGANIVIYPCLISFSLGLILYSQASATWMFLLAAACISTGFGNFNSGANSLAVRDVSNHRVGIATSTYFIFFDVGSGIGPYVLGYILEVTNYQTMYLITACLGLISILVYFIVYGLKESLIRQKSECISLKQTSEIKTNNSYKNS
ncbi:MFS transporter [Peribacillus sp. Hz7]|uniref:MFS transporter n=1 Tax=Peribacillus sp. Hz7 TaxID=3344873 RepID=UPI0035CB8CD4